MCMCVEMDVLWGKPRCNVLCTMYECGKELSRECL